MSTKMNSRLVRVFISSTFRDFIQERDELVKRVFPELRRRCKERFVELLEVDLRWGITEEQSKSGETLRVCLNEIDRCRLSAPVFFVGLLGERYGWVPPRSYFRKDVLEDPNLGWVKEHLDGKSVTELEVLHGVLRNEAMRDKAFFYFRKDGYQDTHRGDIAKYHAAMRPPIAVRPEDFTNQGSERGKKVDDDKQRKLKQAVHDASLKWEPRHYEVPAEMAAMVLEDLWNAIDQAFPAQSVPTEAQRRRLEHEALGQSRVAGYVARPKLYAKLDQWLATAAPALCVVSGESGSGKSALLAAWVAQLGKNAPKHCFIHYIGGTPESSTARSIVFRLLHEIREWGAVTDPVPDDFSEAVAVLPEWLRRAGEGKGDSVLLVLDALNQLENDHELSLDWLPKKLPPGVRLLVSTLPGKADDELRQRKWMTTPVEVPALDPAERRSIIEHFLRDAGKNPDSIPVEKLANASQSANALYLRVVLNELKLRASFGNVEELLDDLLKAKGPLELFVQVLKNLEELDRERPDLVRESLGYLGLARRGLTEGELLELLSDKSIPLSSPLPRHYWSPLYLALADSLVSRSGQLGFFHNYLKQAVESEYLDEDRERKKIHGRLGDVALAWNSERFGHTLGDYAMEHGISHLLEAGEIAAAVALCLDDGFFERSRNRLGSAGPFMQTIQAATERVARLCPENRDLEVALCRLALRQGQIRALLSRSLVFDHPPPSSLTPEAAEICASSSRPLPVQHQWFYALGLLADSAERGGDTHQLREALRIFSQAWPKTVSMTGHDDTWSHFSSDQKEIQDARELLIPELLARLANVDAESAASLLLRLDEGNRLTQLCRCLIRLAKHGRVDAAEKLMHHPVAGGMFETTRPPFDLTPEEYQQQIAFLARQNFYRDFTPEEFVQWNLAKANIQYAIPVFWACYCSQSPALRNPKTIEAIESGLNLHKDHDDPFSLLSSCLSAIVSHGFEPPDSLRQRLQDIWEQEADWENNWYMIREKAREEDDFEEEGRRIRESLRPAMRCATKRRSITDIDWGQRPEQVSRAMRCATKRLPSQRVGSQVIRIARGSKHPLSAWSAQRYDQLKHLRKTRPRFDEFWKEWAAQEHGRLKHLRKTRPRFDGWWTRNGVAKALPDWLRLPARELYPRLLKQAQRGSKDSIRLRSADRFWHQLILFYHESERLGIWSDAQLRTLVTQLTGVDEKLHLIKQLSVGETVDEELQLLTGLYRSGQRDDKAGVTGRSSRTPYDLFVGALDYWSAAAAVVGLIAVRLRVDGALPPEIMNAIDEFAASA